ncbi:MAG: aspartate aminotransferase family protein [Acidobacteria bacterium]|nr:MAG: aspartate aminotransferase family protein [Acidobacteriota bacterium]
MRAEQELLLPTYDRQKVLLTHGRGVYLWDSEGKRYLDFLSGIGVNALGHAHPAITRVLKLQAGKLIHISNLFYHQFQAELAKRLTRISGLDRAFFCNSGTESWEAALKLARIYARANNKNGRQPKTTFIALENSFHGRTFGSLATTGQQKYRAPFEPLVPGVHFVRFNDIEALNLSFDDSVCAICLETVQGEGGINPVSREFLQRARELTKQSGALLLLDEIQSGLGRTGKYFAYQHYGITPDIVTIAKPLAAGLPLGALLTNDRVASAMQPGLHGTTFGGGPLACAVAIEFLRQLQSLLSRVRTTGKYFLRKLQELQKHHSSVKAVRGIGLMLAMELDSADTAKAMVSELLVQGILINRTHDTVLRFLPPYIIQAKHIDQLAKALDHALTNLEDPGAGTPRRNSKKFGRSHRS